MNLERQNHDQESPDAGTTGSADDRYELQEQIGSGGIGTVFKALDRDSGRLVALKLLHAHHSSNPSFIARFRNEARKASRIRHID
jgi:serine/threonine-protein kinase